MRPPWFALLLVCACGLAASLALAGAPRPEPASQLTGDRHGWLPAPALAASPLDTGTAPQRKWRPHVRAARAYASSRTGFTSFALRTPGRLYGYRGRTTTRSASVVKAMLLVAYLNHRSVRRRRLTGSDRGTLGPMVRRSDNSRASRVYGFLGGGALVRLARRVGMRSFSTSPTWGASRITAADQTKFFLGIDRFVVRRHRRYAMRLLGSVVSSQRWGIAQVRPRGWALYFKGGWVPGTENQVGLLRRGRRRVAVAVLTAGQSAAYGRQTEREVARRLLRGLERDSLPR